MKEGTTKKRENKKILSGEKSEGEEKMDKCSTGQKNPLSEKKKA
jgi:hypothetical protein